MLFCQISINHENVCLLRRSEKEKEHYCNADDSSSASTLMIVLMTMTMMIVVHDGDHDERLAQCGSECVSLESAPDGRIFYSQRSFRTVTITNF